MNAEAADAIRHIGSNSFPYLLYAITNKKSALKRKIAGLLPGKLQNWIPASTPPESRGEAVLAFVVLGKQAEPVIPDLAKELRQNEYESCRASALALSAIGPKGWTVLTQTIGTGTRTNESPALYAVLALGGQRAAMPGTLDALESAVTNRTVTFCIADQACWALGRIGLDKEHVVPFLIKAMESPGKRDVNWCAAEGLGEFGTNAESAVPSILQAMQSQNINVKNSARFALRKIDPKTAAQAGDRFPGSDKFTRGVHPKQIVPAVMK